MSTTAEEVQETPPPAAMPVMAVPDWQPAVRGRWNAVESNPSNRSALRLATLPVELTVSGGLPWATVSPSADAPTAELVLVTAIALPATVAVRDVLASALFALPRMKLPPVAA